MTKSKRNIFFISILVIFIIAGCGNPTDKKAGVKTDVKPEKSKDVVYVNVQVQLPTANINADNENNKTDSDAVSYTHLRVQATPRQKNTRTG